MMVTSSSWQGRTNKASPSLNLTWERKPMESHRQCTKLVSVHKSMIFKLTREDWLLNIITIMILANRWPAIINITRRMLANLISKVLRKITKKIWLFIHGLINWSDLTSKRKQYSKSSNFTYINTTELQSYQAWQCLLSLIWQKEGMMATKHFTADWLVFFHSKPLWIWAGIHTEIVSYSSSTTIIS